MIRTMAAVLLLGSSAASWGQATIDLTSPGGDTLSTGQVFTLDLSGNNWSAGAPLDGGGLDLSFNAAVLSLQSVTVDTGVFDLATVFPFPDPSIDNTAGTVTGIDFFTLLNPSATGDFHIADLTFVANAAGSANLSLSENLIGLSSTSPSTFVTSSLVAGTDFNFQTDNVTVKSQSIVAPVPEPSTFWLMAVIAGLAFAMRRRLFGSASGLTA